ncbi:uncharacterized protein C8R40DRAFT_1095048 [Lentinula edodes]|uniref:uncharacterized protein n=1 Tax=Lentinula edodes TaxID=5353 RepID=UPI001E8D412B|nr:uncharacterized protein C8R40DRAFT_1095048 [Lentinula edodes]KAH7877754.1 hypothetical protein C8R40DRAFT_1095048 [Lentinula edodes]
MKTKQKADNSSVITVFLFTIGSGNCRLFRLSSPPSFSCFRVCAFAALFLIIFSTSLLFTALTTESTLKILFPLPHKLRIPWSADNTPFRAGTGPLIPRFDESDPVTSSENKESIYVLSLPHRTDRRARMEYLQNYLGLNWTYMDATYADAEIIGTIMGNVRKIREEAMKARLELQRIRDEKARKKENVDDDFALIVYPDDLEPYLIPNIASPSGPLPHQASQLFSGVKLPFQWPASTFTNISASSEPLLSQLSSKAQILDYLQAFDIYASNHNSNEILGTWRTGSNSSSFVDDIEDHDYFYRFLSNIDTKAANARAYSMVNLELVCTTKDFSLVPYSTTLPYHKYLTAARVAVWHSHLRVLRLIAEEEELRQKNFWKQEIERSDDKNTTTPRSMNEEEDMGRIEAKARTGMRWMRQYTNGRRGLGESDPEEDSVGGFLETPKSDPPRTNDELSNAAESQPKSGRDKYREHISIILEDDIDMEKDIRRRLHRIWIDLPDDWDIVFLGHCWSNESFWPAIFLPTESPETQYATTKGVSDNTLHPSYSPKCTHAYALSPPGVHKLLAHLEYPPFAYSRAIDQAYAWLVSSNKINAYSVVGSVIVQVKGTVTNSSSPNDKGDEVHESGEGEGSIGIGDVWRPGRKEDAGNGTGALPVVSTSSWTEELINGVFAELK